MHTVTLKSWLTRTVCLGLLILLTGCVSTPYAQRPNVQQFIEQMASEHHFDRQQLTVLFQQAKHDKRIIKAMTAPREKLPWDHYRSMFVTTDRADQGARFWRQHASALAYAQQRYGVPPEMITAIIGIETNYGRTQGSFSALDSLTTLAFDYPPRATYFLGELEQYLLLTREIPLDPLLVRSSYAGALGMPQFMPSSYREYAVSYQRPGRGNLFTNADDAIVSVANYFKAHGWKPGDQIAIPMRVRSGPGASLLMLMRSDNTAEYWYTFHNFHVITRYNTSSQYAMAAYLLSERIRAIYSKNKRA